MVDHIRTKQLNAAGVPCVVEDGAIVGDVVVKMSRFQFDQFLAYARQSERHVNDAGNVKVRGR